VIAFTESLRARRTASAMIRADCCGNKYHSLFCASHRRMCLATPVARAADEEKLRREKKKGGKKRLQRLLFLNTKGAIIFII
jgi:hypothetical protein